MQQDETKVPVVRSILPVNSDKYDAYGKLPQDVKRDLW